MVPDEDPEADDTGSAGHAERRYEELRGVSADERCPVCNHDSWCSLGDGGLIL